MRSTPNLDVRTSSGDVVTSGKLIHYFDDMEYGTRLHNGTTKCFDYGVHMNELLTEDSKVGIFEQNYFK
jgi:hypothetical protein